MALNFNDLVERFGDLMAWSLLVEVERAARLAPQYHIADPEARLAAALRVQDAMAA